MNNTEKSYKEHADRLVKELKDLFLFVKGPYWVLYSAEYAIEKYEEFCRLEGERQSN